MGGSPNGGVVEMKAAARGRNTAALGRGAAVRKAREAVDAEARKNVREIILNRDVCGKSN